jgi:predicted ATPase/DNA-binding SARP family transcriptional activator
MPRLAISLLGSFLVALDGEPVSGFVSKKAQALLAYLAVEADRPHQREALTGLLWPDYREGSARTNLRSVLANLRQVIGDRQAAPPFLKITRQTIQFNQASDHQLDVAIFNRLSAAGAPARPTIEALKEAATVYQGPFLAGFSLPDSPAFEEWALLRREEFARQASEALGRLTSYYEGQGMYEQALAHAQRRVKLDPWQEEAQRQVMKLLALSGRRSEALAQYETCRHLLAEELGVEPAAETIELYEQILSRGEDSFFPLYPRSPAPLHNLSLPLTPLIGRETELADLSRLLANPDRRLVTVVGPGGVGKSRLALAVAAAQGQYFKDGVYLASLARLPSAEALAPAIAEALHFSFYENSPLEQQLLDYLRHKHMLLVLDNFEHLLAPPSGGAKGGEGLIITLLETAPGLKILTTSRTRLNVQGEQLYPLAGLSYPDEEVLLETGHANNTGRYGALELFEHSARRLRPDFVLTDDNLAGAVHICHLVEGRPLGILLASAWVELLSPGEIATEIEHSFEFLQADLHDLPQRQRSLRAVFEHSWQLLTQREQAIFQQLAIFRGGFSREAAQAVTGATLADLLALVNRFLLHRTPAGPFEVHELLRQYAAQKLAQAPAEEKAARQRHSAFYAAFLGRREADLKGPRQREALAEIETEGENIRLAWGWAVEQGEVEHLDQAINTLGYFYQWRGRYQDGEAACRAAAERLKEIVSGKGPVPSRVEALRLSAQILHWQGLFNRLMGHSDLAAQLVRQSLSLLEGPALAGQDTQPEQAAILLEIGQQTDNLVEARCWFERGLSLYRSLDDPWGTARALYLLGDRLRLAGADEGRQLIEESLPLYQTLSDQRGIAGVLDSLGFIAMLQGQAEKGENLLRQSLALRREMADKASIAHSLALLATGLVFCGRFAEVHSLGEERLRLSQDLGNRPMIARSNALLAVANLHLGRYEQARSQGQMSLRLYQAIDDPFGVSYALWNLGGIALAEGAYTEAERLLGGSVAIHREIGARNRLHDVLASLGYTAWSLGKIAQARQCLFETLRMTLENRFFYTGIQAIFLAALLSVERGKPEQAVELYALASRYPLVANSHWFEDVIGRPIAAVAATLAPEVVAAAQARGKARDLEATVRELVAELEAG